MRWTREVLLALFSAFLGAFASYIVQREAEPRRALTILESGLHSRTADYALAEDKGPPALAIQQYSIKNSGDVVLTNVELEFAPAGGDAAYDVSRKQAVWFSSLSDEHRTGRVSARLRKTANSVYLHYDRLRPGEVDTLVITHDGTADSYDISSDDPALRITTRQAETELAPDLDTGWSNRLFTMSATILESLASGILTAGAILTIGSLRRRRSARKVLG